MKILHSDRKNLPTLPLLRQTRDALARYCELRWPVGRCKEIAKAFNLNVDQARSVMSATASAATIDKVWKAGGWAVVLPVLSSVIGESVEDFLITERRKQLETAQRTGALVRHLRAVSGPGPDAGPAGGSEPAGEGAPRPRRRAG